MIIDGKKTALELREELKKIIINLKSTFNSVPALTVILIGEDPASKIYVKNKQKFAKEVGINSEVIKYSKNIEEKVIIDKQGYRSYPFSIKTELICMHAIIF